MITPNLAHLHTTRSWNTLLGALRGELRKWGMAEFFLPTKTDSRNSGRVGVEILGRNGQWREIVCSRFPSPEQNLAAILLAVESYRKADQRGIAGLYTDVSQLLALPSANGAHTVLGVANGVSREDLKTAYRKKLQESHPDHGGSTEAFQQVRDAGVELGLA